MNALNASHYEENSAIESMIDGYLSNSSENIAPSGPDVIERFNSIRGTSKVPCLDKLSDYYEGTISD